MKAVLIRQFSEDPRTHHVEEVADPIVGPDDVLISVKAASLNFPDLLVMSGKYQVLPERPFIPGKDAAGIVEAVGSNVRSLKAGDHVVAQVENGCFASRLSVHQASVHKIPSEIAFVDAAAMGLVYQTAFFALTDRGGFRKGETVLISGAAGGVGLAAVQIAKGLGAKILAGVTSEAQAEAVRQSGADEIIDLSATNLAESLRDQVYHATNNKGADVFLDPVGGDVFDASIRALARRGRAVIIGFAAGKVPVIKGSYLLLKNISVAGMQWTDYSTYSPELVADAQAKLNELYIQGFVRPHITQTFPLESFADAAARLASRGVVGKLVLTIQ